MSWFIQIAPLPWMSCMFSRNHAVLSHLDPQKDRQPRDFWHHDLVVKYGLLANPPFRVDFPRNSHKY